MNFLGLFLSNFCFLGLLLAPGQLEDSHKPFLKLLDQAILSDLSETKKIIMPAHGGGFGGFKPISNELFVAALYTDLGVMCLDDFVIRVDAPSLLNDQRMQLFMRFGALANGLMFRLEDHSRQITVSDSLAVTLRQYSETGIIRYIRGITNTMEVVSTAFQESGRKVEISYRNERNGNSGAVQLAQEAGRWKIKAFNSVELLGGRTVLGCDYSREGPLGIIQFPEQSWQIHYGVEFPEHEKTPDFTKLASGKYADYSVGVVLKGKPMGEFTSKKFFKDNMKILQLPPTEDR